METLRRDNTETSGEVSRLTEWANELQEQKLQLTEANNQVFENKTEFFVNRFSKYVVEIDQLKESIAVLEKDLQAANDKIKTAEELQGQSNNETTQQIQILREEISAITLEKEAVLIKAFKKFSF